MGTTKEAIGKLEDLLSKLDRDEDVQDPLELLIEAAKAVVLSSKGWPEVTTYQWEANPTEVKSPIWVRNYTSNSCEFKTSGTLYRGDRFILGKTLPIHPAPQDNYIVRIGYWPRDNENGPREYEVATFWNYKDSSLGLGFNGAYTEGYVRGWGGFKLHKVFALNRWDAKDKAESLRIAMESSGPTATVAEAQGILSDLG